MKRTRLFRALVLAGLVLVVPFVLAQFPHAAAPTQGLVGYWALDDGSGTSAADGSGNNNNGLLSGAGATWTTAAVVGGLNFSGSSGQLSINNSTSISLTGSFTSTAWIKPSSLSGYQTILNKGGSNGCSYWLQTAGNQISAGLSTSSTCSSYKEHLTTTANLSANVWSHIAAVYDRGAATFKVYLNGGLILSQTESSKPVATSEPLVIGRSSCSSCSFERWRGTLDEIRLYNRALSAQEVLDVYNAQAPPSAPDTQSPISPAGLTATAVSVSQINLSWGASTDNIGVIGYRVYRDGVAVGTTTPTSFSDTGLAASTTYSYAVSAFDAAGNSSALSASASAKTWIPSLDSQAPSIALTAPAAGAIVAGSAVTVSATASDNVAVASVQFLLDGQPLGSLDATSPFSVAWNTTLTTAGPHTLSAMARDTAGNPGAGGNVGVTVDNQPPTGGVSINNGAAATNTRSVTLNLSASDVHTSVTRMRFSNTGSSYSTAQNYAPTAMWTLSFGSGTRTVYAQFKDKANNWSAAATDTIVVDSTAPTISSVFSNNVTSSSATISWATNEAATSRVEYGLTTSYGQTTALDPALVSSHTIGLTGLATATSYNYRVRSIDAAGNEAIGANATLTTVDAPDTTAPQVSISAPSDGAIVSGLVTLTATATDNRAVASVQFWINGQALGAEDTVAPYSIVWDSRSVANDDYAVSAVASDTSNNTAPSASVTVTASNDEVPPTLQGEVTANTTSASTIAVNWQPAQDDVAVVGYYLYRSGSAEPLATTGNTNYIDSALAPATTYTYQIAAYDAAGNVSAKSDPVSATTQPATSVAFPLKVSTDGRYLVDQNDRPFFMNGDTAWSLIAELSNEETDLYLENRRQKGYNLVLTSLIEHDFASNAPANFYGVQPFTAPGNFNTPNEAYFAHADWVISHAAAKGLIVLLAPLYLGYQCESEGWCSEVGDSSTTTMQNWGAYVGNRYKNFPNIIWVIGADTDPVASGVGNKVQAFVTGLTQADPNHLITAHNDAEQAAMDPWPNATWLKLNNVYTYSSAYLSSATQYNRTPFKPFFLIESTYENEHSVTARALRSQAYWTVLSGGVLGHVFGNCPIWHFGAAPGFCSSSLSWQTQLDSTGSRTVALVGRLFTSRAFQMLVPDPNHQVLTAGYQSGSTLATAASASDGSTLMAFIPTQRTVTIAMTKVSGVSAAAWWFNTRTGAATFIGNFATTGTQTFTPPDSNDWVLVVDDAALDLPPPGA